MSPSPADALELTIERIFDDPPLAGRIAQQIRYAPNAKRIAYLRSAGDDHERLDLWVYDRGTREARRLLDSSTVAAADVELSEEEKARRERTRTSATGIVEYQWLPYSTGIVFPLDCRARLLHVDTGELRALTPSDRFVTHLKISPRGTWLAYLSERDLHVLDVAGGHVQHLTSDGSDTVSNGLADFIAQEEMHRFDGYWWSPDERHIAFTRVDESSIPITHRHEISAGEITIHPQRYPYAGESNARVELVVVEVGGAQTHRIGWRREDEDYLARVWWLADSELAFLRQRRDQTQMELVFANLAGELRVVLEETSATWLNLHDDFALIESRQAFVWSSERSGTNQLYLHRTDGTLDRSITEIAGCVGKLLCVDEATHQVFFEGWSAAPEEQHLFVAPLEGSPDDALDETTRPRQLTHEPGCHEITIAPDHATFVDLHSSLMQPPRILLRGIDGTIEFAIDANEVDAPNELGGQHPYHPFAGAHAVPQFGRLDAEDGQPLVYRITRPPEHSPGPHPAVVVVYGGPGVQRVRDQWPPMFQQFLAGHGYVVMELDNRGSSNRGRGFEAPIHRRLGETEVRDQVRGAQHLAALPYVDESRIGVFGHSYGGYMAIMSLAKAAEHFRCAVAVAPVSDWRLYDTHYTERFLGQPGENPDGYRASSVFPYLHAITGPLLVMHGMADDNVLFTHTTRLIHALQEQGTLFELMTYPGAKHSLGGRNVSVHRYRLIHDFFERHLK